MDDGVMRGIQLYMDEDLDAQLGLEAVRTGTSRSDLVRDATSFELMHRDWIIDALAFDGDFSAAGFVELRP